LRSQPIVGVVLAILCAVGCASTRPGHVYLPTDDEAVYSYFVDGIPFALVQTECAEVVASLEPTRIGNSQYLRVYLSYENLTDEPYLLEPLRAMFMRGSEGDKPFPRVEASGPSQVLGRVRREKDAALFAQALVGALQAATVRPTTVKGPGTHIKIDDTDLKRLAIADRTAAAMAATEASGEGLRGFISGQILRRNTVWPGRLVDGFVYFPIPFVSPGSGGVSDDDLAEYVFHLTVATQCDSAYVEFRAIEGE